MYIFRSIGNIRDPGIILYALQDIFNKIEDHLLEDHVTIKLSIFHFDQDLGFRDLLIDPKQSF